jgi:hypothetical protein
MDRAFTLERITATKAMIVEYENAVTALGTQGGVQSYTLDTGQSRQTVTRADIPALNGMLDSLYNRLATLEARVYGGTVTARPAW